MSIEESQAPKRQRVESAPSEPGERPHFRSSGCFHRAEEVAAMNAAKGIPWEVFISHGGADVDGTHYKKTFVSFLHARLEQAGIQAFMDEKSLEPGDPAWEVMQDAVRRCRIAVPVLTAGYDNSEWCLQELAIMLDAPGVTVMPLFLDQDGTEVNKKIQDAAERLASAGSYSSAKVAAWQRALALVASQTGWLQDQTSGCFLIAANSPANATCCCAV